MNFGETLAYWYLRLNGFFPLSNFVLHRIGNKGSRSADSDILAIRFPHVYEGVGGQANDWDWRRFAEWDIDLQNDTVSVIVEVKTGQAPDVIAQGAERAFSKDRLRYALGRLGAWPQEKNAKIVERLSQKPYYRATSNHVVAKVLITATLPPASVSPTYLTLPLRDVEDFIIRRMDNYIDPKNSSRMFFPSDLIQYIIWNRKNLRDDMELG